MSPVVVVYCCRTQSSRVEPLPLACRFLSSHSIRKDGPKSTTHHGPRHFGTTTQGIATAQDTFLSSGLAEISLFFFSRHLLPFRQLKLGLVVSSCSAATTRRLRLPPLRLETIRLPSRRPRAKIPRLQQESCAARLLEEASVALLPHAHLDSTLQANRLSDSCDKKNPPPGNHSPSLGLVPLDPTAKTRSLLSHPSLCTRRRQIRFLLFWIRQSS